MNKEVYTRIWGNIALLRFDKGDTSKEKKAYAKKILRDYDSVTTVVEKVVEFSGRFRTQKTKHLAGKKTKIACYSENNCEFEFNTDETYFSSSLATERKEVCQFVKKGDVVLSMFAGVSPFPIVIAKNTNVEKIYANELNSKANKYAKISIKKSGVEDKIKLIPGNIRIVADRLAREGKTFDLILMTRPNLEDNFLSSAFRVSKSGTRIYYHAFCGINEGALQVNMVKEEAKRAGFKVKILNTKNIGNIGLGKMRFGIYFKIRKKIFGIF